MSVKKPAKKKPAEPKPKAQAEPSFYTAVRTLNEDGHHYTPDSPPFALSDERAAALGELVKPA